MFDAAKDDLRRLNPFEFRAGIYSSTKSLAHFNELCLNPFEFRAGIYSFEEASMIGTDLS